MKVNIKELSELIGSKAEASNITQSAIGKYCIVRSRNEGINFGKVVMADKTGVVIEEARRIYYHKPLDSNLSWYEGVAETGLHSESKISGIVNRKYIIEAYSLTFCTKGAIQNIKNYVAHKS
jgi:hypothetical protein